MKTTPLSLRHFFQVLTLVLGLTVLFVSQSFADREESPFTVAVHYDNDQIKKIAKQTPVQCPADYKTLFAQDTIRISLFNGYENFENTTEDANNAKAMAHTLQKKCIGNLEACEFKLVLKKKHSMRLEKTIAGKKILISIYSSSVTSDNAANMSYEYLRQEQAKLSQAIKNQFYKDLVSSDVVFYSGHSRVGSGLGFEGEELVPMAFNILFRFPLTPILKSLAQRPSRLKMLALFSCESERYYRKDIERANPGISLLLTNDNIEDVEGEQMSLGALNSILTQKCYGEFKKSMVPEFYPTHHLMEYIRR